jgi:hypothetical protein
MFDQKSMPTHSGRQYIGTSLDKTTGLFDAILISGPTGAEAIRQIKHFQRLGKTIGAAIFDRHASYLTDRAFRDFLEQEKIQPYYNKSALDADDPRFIADLERCHQEINHLVRSLPDPWDWTPSLLDFVALINKAPQEALAGISRSGMAFGHSPVESRAVAIRHKSLVLATRDDQKVEMPPWKPGDMVMVNSKFKSNVSEARKSMRCLEVHSNKSLLQYRDELPRWVHTAHINPLGKAARLPQALDAVPCQPVEPPAEVPEIKEEKGELPVAPVPEPVEAGEPEAKRRKRRKTKLGKSKAEEKAVDSPVLPGVPEVPEEKVCDATPQPKKGDWVILTEGRSPWFGIVTLVMKDQQFRVHQWKLREPASETSLGIADPLWRNKKGRSKAGSRPQGQFDEAEYNVSIDNVILAIERMGGNKLPIEGLRALADYSRNN